MVTALSFSQLNSHWYWTVNNNTLLQPSLFLASKTVSSSFNFYVYGPSVVSNVESIFLFDL